MPELRHSSEQSRRAVELPCRQVNVAGNREDIADAQRKELLRSRLLLVHGVWQREGDVKNLIAGKLEDLTPMLGRLVTESRDFK